MEKGLDQLRLAEIGRRTNMSTGHVLYYFGTKDRILRETLLWTEDSARPAAARGDRRREAGLATTTRIHRQLSAS